MVGILLTEVGSLQAGDCTHQPGEGSPLLLGGNRPLQGGNHQPGVGIHRPVGGSPLLLEDSRLVQGGIHFVQGGSRLLGEDMLLVEVGSPLPGEGNHQTEEGILDSSSSESENR